MMVTVVVVVVVVVVVCVVVVVVRVCIVFRDTTVRMRTRCIVCLLRYTTSSLLLSEGILCDVVMNTERVLCDLAVYRVQIADTSVCFFRRHFPNPVIRLRVHRRHTIGYNGVGGVDNRFL